jgi:nucleosome binding factor SPN SPT16 subunit
MLLHFVVKKPLMMGKRTSNHIQVFANIGDDVDHLSGKHAHHLSEKESIRMEENEFKMRRKFRKVFRRFASEIERMMKEHGYTLKFEVPKENLGFQAQFSRGLVNIYPTSTCLVALDEMPFFVLNMKDIEIAFFERLGSLGYSAQTGTFEMTYVYKEYSKEDGFVKLDSIQRYYREEDEKTLLKDRVVELKKLLLAHNIPYLEQPFALNWKKLMAQIREQIEAMMGEGEANEDDEDEDGGGWKPFSSGGWLAILGGDDESGSEKGSDGGNSDEDGEEGEFVPSGDEDNDDDDDEFSEHVDSDSSDGSGDEYGDGDGDDDDDDEGAEDEEDWDIQEKRLAQEDRTKRRFDSDDEEEEEDLRPVRRRKK